MTTQEWKDHLKVVYHPLLSKSYSNKIKYEKNFRDVQEMFDKQQSLLLQITEMLLDTRPCHANETGRAQPVVPYDKFL